MRWSNLFRHLSGQLQQVLANQHAQQQQLDALAARLYEFQQATALNFANVAQNFSDVKATLAEIDDKLSPPQPGPATRLVFKLAAPIKK